MTATLPIEGVVRLDHWGVIRARGADAARFLHSQLTNEMAALERSRARWAGFCSAKGRLQASFLAWRGDGDEILLACAADVLAPTFKRLSMFVLRAHCRLDDASAEVSLFGLAGAAAQTAVEGMAVLDRRDADGGAALIRLPDAAGTVRAVWAGAPAAAPAATALLLDTWRWLDVMSGVPQIVAATADQFVPQMLNFEVVGGVDFQKGCYPGQEVVARSQYRGTIKRRAFVFDADAPLAPGAEVFHDADPGQPAGMVVNAAASPRGGWSALVEVKLVAVGAGTLHLGGAQGPPLRLVGLPYPLPSSETEAA